MNNLQICVANPITVLLLNTFIVIIMNINLEINASGVFKKLYIILILFLSCLSKHQKLKSKNDET